jgi:hypothetical protein
MFCYSFVEMPITYNYEIHSAKRRNYVWISGKANYQPDTESI